MRAREGWKSGVVYCEKDIVDCEKDDKIAFSTKIVKEDMNTMNMFRSMTTTPRR